MTDGGTVPDPSQLALFDLGPPAAEPERAPDPAPVPPPPPAAAVSAARQVRALTLHLPIVADADPDPPGYDGWRDHLGAERPRIAGGTCTELARRQRPDGTLAPCAWTACPHHLAVDQGEVVDLGPVREAELVASTAGLPVEMGRRPSLSAIPETAGEVHDFADGVAARLDGRAPPLPYSCTLDVVREYPDGAPIAVVASALGVSEELVRVIGLKVARLWFGAEHPDAWANLEAVIERKTDPVRRAPPVRPSKVAPPPTVPRAIVRVEREAPPPREPSAEDLFTF
jgi:hypothetical protein